MRKLIFILILTMLLCGSVEGATKIGLDRLNWSQGLPSGIEISWRNIADAPFNVNDYGAAGDGTTDDSQAMQDTIDAAYAEYMISGDIQTAYFPPGKYLVGTSRANYTGGDTYGILLQPRPGVRIIGAGMDSTTWIAPDDYRNATRGVSLLYNMNVSEFCDGLEIAGITFDNNGDQNLVASGTSNYTWIGSNNCANVKIHDCKFKDTTGLWAIYIGHDNLTTNKNAWIYNNVFENVSTGISGSISPDHTSIYSNLDNTIIWNNQFDGGAYDAVGSAFELHGNDSSAFGNNIKNYRWGCHIAPSGYGGDHISGISVHDNMIATSSSAVQMWVQTADQSIGVLDISNNIINITNTGAGTYGRAIYNYDTTGPIEDLIVKGNVIELTTESDYGYGMVLGGAENIVCTENVIRDASAVGILLGVDSHFQSGDVSGNFLENCTTSIHALSGISRTVMGGSLRVNYNGINSTGAYGIITDATNVTKISLIGNDIVGSATAEISVPTSTYSTEQVLVDHVSHDYKNSFQYISDGSRIMTPYTQLFQYGAVGRTVEYLADAPSTGYHTVGSIIWHTDGTGGQPIGWYCTATGVPGTWKAMNTTV